MNFSHARNAVQPAEELKTTGLEEYSTSLIFECKTCDSFLRNPSKRDKLKA